MFAKDGHFNLRNELPARLSEGNRCNLCTDTFIIKYSYSKATIRSIFFSIAGRHDLCLCHRSAKLQVVKQKRVTFDIDRTTMTLACALCVAVRFYASGAANAALFQRRTKKRPKGCLTNSPWSSKASMELRTANKLKSQMSKLILPHSFPSCFYGFG